MARKPKRAGKGQFGEPKLPVARRYVVPARRSALWILGVIAGLAIWAYTAVDRQVGGTFMSGGPLTSAHAVLEADCASCHGGFEPVADVSCNQCHEKYGSEIGDFSFAAHYLYRSNDFQRVVASELETPCAACHVEHKGRQADLTAVVDAQCLSCHPRGSFGDGHPEFEFAADFEGDNDALSFGHGLHVRELMDTRGFADVERACLVCHQPEPDGRNFGPISFDLHCESCHLTEGTATARLAVASDLSRDGEVTAEKLGVETLDMIRAGRRPGTDWAFYSDPGELRQAGSSVTKTTIYHADPWILHNLRRLRTLLYGEAGLADLLATTPEVAAGEQRRLYEEALATLREQLRGLRGTRDAALQAQADELEALLTRVEQALADPLAPIDETEFLLALGQPKGLDPSLEEEAELLIADLTEPCSGCHWVEDATIVRVDGDQRTLKRAEFDHGAHVIQSRCLDCHHRIPILEVMSGESPDPATDNSAIHNLPTIDSCRQCHTPKQAAASCVSCHLFHPDTDRRSDFLRYVSEDDLVAMGRISATDTVPTAPASAAETSPAAGTANTGATEADDE